MRRSLLLVVVAALAACGPDSRPFAVSFVLERNPGYKCSSDSCEAIGMACDVAMLVRVARVADDTAYISECSYISGGGGSLCSLADVALPSEAIPNEVVKVQVAVWRQADLPQALRDAQQCPKVDFDLQNTPSADPTPAIGGQAYFAVGSTETAPVTLQCIDDTRLNAPECRGVPDHVTAGIDEFDILSTVIEPTASRLDVSVAPPSKEVGSNEWILDPADTVILARRPLASVPTWQAVLDHPIEDVVCLQDANRLELAGATTIMCASVAGAGTLDLRGMYVPKAILDRVGTAVHGIPATGMVLGVVIDANGQPAANVVVTPSTGAVAYLSEDYTSTADDLGLPLAGTTASGAFVSTDASFGSSLQALTEWHADNGTVNEKEPAIGGLVRGKLTFVKLELKSPP